MFILRGGGLDQASRIAIDGIGNICVTGRSRSVDFPVTPDALFAERVGSTDCFLWVFDPISNEVLFSTYFGGSLVDWDPDALQLVEGRIWIVTKTESPDIPVTENAFQQTLADTNVQLGDVMLAAISLDPPTIDYCTYMGGGGEDRPNALAVKDSALFVAGYTMSQNFPVSADAFDTVGWQTFSDREAFVASLNWRTGAYRGTYLGGSSGDMVVENSFQIGATSITLLGETWSDDFPVTPDAYQPNRRNGFIVKLNRELTEVLYGTFIGGTGYEEYNAAYVENSDSLWIVGEAHSFDLPVTPNAIQPTRQGLYSGFVLHFAIDTTADTTDAVGRIPLPAEFSLSAYPNPFNSTLSIVLTIPPHQDATVTLFDLLGREVDVIHQGRLETNTISYAAPPSLASGVYFVRATAGDISAVRKVALVK